MKAIYFILLLSLVIISCDPQDQYIEAVGTLEKQGITTYQYGTHILVNSDQRYTLRSEQLHLDSFIDHQVRLHGKKVEGYPIEGGPVLLEVIDIEKED